MKFFITYVCMYVYDVLAFSPFCFGYALLKSLAVTKQIMAPFSECLVFSAIQLYCLFKCSIISHNPLHLGISTFCSLCPAMFHFLEEPSLIFQNRIWCPFSVLPLSLFPSELSYTVLNIHFYLPISLTKLKAATCPRFSWL